MRKAEFKIFFFVCHRQGKAAGEENRGCLFVQFVCLFVCLFVGLFACLFFITQNEINCIFIILWERELVLHLGKCLNLQKKYNSYEYLYHPSPPPSQLF